MDDILKTLILEKLGRRNAWGAKHIPIDYVRKGLPEHYIKTHEGRKLLDVVFKELISVRWLILSIKRTGKGSGIHVSLNPRKFGEIMQFLEQELI